jgi:hypothetical protein
MSVQTQPKPEEKIKTSLVVREELWKKVRKLAIDVNRDASDLVELSLRVLLAIVEAGTVPDDLGEVLSRYDPEALEELRKVVKAAR